MICFPEIEIQKEKSQESESDFVVKKPSSSTFYLEESEEDKNKQVCIFLISNFDFFVVV